MTLGRKVLAIDTPTLLACANIPASTLNSWVAKKLCRPHVEKGRGKRATRYWTIQDLVVVKAIRALREAGCPLSVIASVQKLLSDAWDRGLENSVLFYDGRAVIVIDGADGVAVAVSERMFGQAVFKEALTSMTFPLGAWISEGHAAAEPIDIGAIRARRKEIRARRAG